MSTTRSKKVLIPLATMLAAGAVAVGSGATFTSTSGNSISAVTSGSLEHTNSKDGGAIFDLTDVKPGDTLNGGLVVTNTGSLPARFSLTEATSANEFGADYLQLVITNVTTGQQVYRGDFGGLANGTRNEVGVIAPDTANEFRFTVTLAADAPNTEQGKTASASYTWDSTQLEGTTTDQ